MKLTKAFALVASLIIAPIVSAATATDVSNESALKQKLTETAESYTSPKMAQSYFMAICMTWIKA